MSERIFQAIRESFFDGLEAVLKEVERVAFEEHDYSTVWRAKCHLKRLELGLPESAKSKELAGKEDALRQLREAKNQFRGEAGEHYRADGKFKEAAIEFLGAGRYKDAIDMYLREGSDKSLDRAAFLAIHSDVDYKLGFDLRIQRGQIKTAFSELKDIKSSDNFGPEERQQLGEYLTRAAYNAVVEAIKAKIEKQEGKKPKGETIPQLLEGREGMHIFVYDGDIDSDFNESIRYASESSDPGIIQMGIDLNAFRARRARDPDKQRYETTGIFLRGKLTGAEDCIQYFIRKAEERQQKGKSSFRIDAKRAVEILKHHKRYDAALEVAERFLSPQHKVRFELLEKLGDTKRLAAAYREMNNPIGYALILNRINEKK